MAAKVTTQEQAWSSQVGQEYTDRNTMTVEELDELYWDCFGTTRWKLNVRFLLDFPDTTRILEVGCNIGMQLRHLQKMGFTNLHGIELQQYAIDHLCVENVDVQQGNAIKLPYLDRDFDLVFTSGVLIHLPEPKLHQAMTEIVRVSNRWIWGFEYYSIPRTQIPYQARNDLLWSDDFPDRFLFAGGGNIRLIRRWSEVHRTGFPGVVADMYLLEKV